MNAKVMACGVAIAVLFLLIYSQLLLQRQKTLQLELAAEVTEQNDLNTVKTGLETDIARAKKLQGEITVEMGLEEEAFHLLAETLANIQAKLRGVEKLKGAIDNLRKEYEGFKTDVEEYKLLRDGRNHERNGR